MNINSHVQLPNCVLRNFRDETDPEKKVWYLDVQTGDIMRKSSKKLGTCKGYYSETGERLWAENIENPLSIITHRIQKYGCAGLSERRHTIDATRNGVRRDDRRRFRFKCD